jgi:hypothetical protein
MIDAFAYGLLRVIGPPGVLVWTALSVFGTAGAASGFAQDYSEAPGAPRNLEGFLHNTFVIVAVSASRSRCWCSLGSLGYCPAGGG